MNPSVSVNVRLGDLASLADHTDKGMHDHGFVEVYERFFFQFMNQPIRILEIGIYEGASLELWYKYFTQGKIFGIDLSTKAEYDNDRVTTFIADQSKRDQLQSFIDTHGGDFDIIIDDGGHYMNQQQISFGFLFPFVKPGGYYVIEDIHTSIPHVYREFGATHSDSTLSMIENFARKLGIHSSHMTHNETEYLKSNIDLISLNTRNRGSRSMTCLIKKRL